MNQLRTGQRLISSRLGQPSLFVQSTYCVQPLRRQYRSSVPLAQASDDKFRPFYVTSPIFYVNAEPHAGHLYTLLLADVFKRWEVLKGDHQAALLTGTDEHGMKIQKAAEKAKVPTKEFCDKHAAQFLDLAVTANASFDRFIRTTDEDHKAAVRYFWNELKARDYIYQSTHDGWYSVSDETFYPESQVHFILDPHTGRKFNASKETGKEVEWTSETNYHFRLSAFKDRLLEHYEQHPNFIVPETRMNFIKSEVSAGLKDLSVSRPSSRLQWGIRVPDDESQTIYVWLDALINYLSATGYPSTEGDKHKLWPPNVQVIGKDIIRFHTIYWPAFLMALDLPLPRGFLTHAHWTMGEEKMSKSLGNVVNPFMAIDRYGLDSIRYFMIHDGGIVDDSKYDNSYIVKCYKRGLQGGLGNLMTRVVRGRSWSIQQAVESANSAPFLEALQQESNFSAMAATIDRTAKDADSAMRALNPRAALHTIMDLVYDVNRFFHETEPWNLVKLTDEASRQQLHKVLFTTVDAIRVICILLQPFMPDKMKQALDDIRVGPDMRNYDMTKFGCDTTYGVGVSEDEQLSRPKQTAQRKKQAHDKVLFPPLITEF